jgi:hypothetical protein
LRYQGHIEAGKNFLNNGAMDVWQRGTSFTNGGIYGPDRWFLDISAATTTWARETTIIPTGCQYSLKATQATAASTVVIAQTIETLNAVALAGQTVSLSAYVAASASTTLTFELAYSTSVDNPRSGSWTAITATSGGSTTVSTTTFSRLAGVYAIPSTAKTLKVTLFTSSLGVGVSMYISGLQLELGSVPTTLSRLGGSIQGELAACQRYYQRANYIDSATIASGQAFSATLCGMAMVAFPVQMRIVPSGAVSGATHFKAINAVGGTFLASSAVSVTTSLNSVGFSVMTVATGLVAGNGTTIFSNNANCYIEMSAEL